MEQEEEEDEFDWDAWQGPPPTTLDTSHDLTYSQLLAADDLNNELEDCDSVLLVVAQSGVKTKETQDLLIEQFRKRGRLQDDLLHILDKLTKSDPSLSSLDESTSPSTVRRLCDMNEKDGAIRVVMTEAADREGDPEGPAGPGGSQMGAEGVALEPTAQDIIRQHAGPVAKLTDLFEFIVEGEDALMTMEIKLITKHEQEESAIVEKYASLLKEKGTENLEDHLSEHLLSMQALRRRQYTERLALTPLETIAGQRELEIAGTASAGHGPADHNVHDEAAIAATTAATTAAGAAGGPGAGNNVSASTAASASSATSASTSHLQVEQDVIRGPTFSFVDKADTRPASPQHGEIRAYVGPSLAPGTGGSEEVPTCDDDVRDRTLARIMSAEEFADMMDWADNRLSKLAQVEESEENRSFLEKKELFGLRAHLQDELLRIVQILKEDDPKLDCLADSEESFPHIVGRLRQLNQQAQVIEDLPQHGGGDAASEDTAAPDRVTAWGEGDQHNVAVERSASMIEAVQEDVRQAVKIDRFDFLEEEGEPDVETEEQLIAKHKQEDDAMAEHYAGQLPHKGLENLAKYLAKHLLDMQTLRKRQDQERAKLKLQLSLQQESELTASLDLQQPGGTGTMQEPAETKCDDLNLTETTETFAIRGIHLDRQLSLESVSSDSSSHSCDQPERSISSHRSSVASLSSVGLDIEEEDVATEAGVHQVQGKEGDAEFAKDINLDLQQVYDAVGAAEGEESKPDEAEVNSVENLPVDGDTITKLQSSDSTSSDTTGKPCVDQQATESCQRSSSDSLESLPSADANTETDLATNNVDTHYLPKKQVDGFKKLPEAEERYEACLEMKSDGEQGDNSAQNFSSTGSDREFVAAVLQRRDISDSDIDKLVRYHLSEGEGALTEATAKDAAKLRKNLKHQISQRREHMTEADLQGLLRQYHTDQRALRSRRTSERGRTDDKLRQKLEERQGLKHENASTNGCQEASGSFIDRIKCLKARGELTNEGFDELWKSHIKEKENIPREKHNQATAKKTQKPDLSSTRDSASRLVHQHKEHQKQITSLRQNEKQHLDEKLKQKLAARKK